MITPSLMSLRSGEAEMLLRRHVAEHGAAVPAAVVRKAVDNPSCNLSTRPAKVGTDYLSI